MPRTKSIKHCPRCDRDLAVLAFDARPRINGQSNGYRPRCRECTSKSGESLRAARLRSAISEPNPSGLCMCGCGNRTPLATQSHSATGNVIGKPRRYIAGHQGTRNPFTPDHYTINPETQCWEWSGTLGTNGYGQSCFRGCPTPAHRLYYMHFVGPIPDGTEIDHLCRNRKCCNPAHLEAVPRVVNLRRGLGTKMTPEQVVEIRRLWATGKHTQQAIGDMFGITRGAVLGIINYKSWKDIA